MHCSRQLLLHCSTFARPWARTSCMTAKDGGNAKGLSGTILAHAVVSPYIKKYKTFMKNRRTFLAGLLAGLPLSLFSRLLRAEPPTPSETEGPFYPVLAQKDKDFDLTKIQGQQGVAMGKVIVIEGQVRDTRGRPIEDATIDLWQANAVGRYRHHRDRNTAPLDPNFQGWAIVKSGYEGRFRFKTIFPGVYPASAEWLRPPHIHFKINKEGFPELTTQMYFPGQKLNGSDLLLMQKSDEDMKRMIAKKEDSALETYSYTIVLQKP